MNGLSWEQAVKSLSDLPMTDPIGTVRMLETTGEIWVKEENYWKIFGHGHPDEYLIRTTKYGNILYGNDIIYGA